jgi:hypothetical protein
MEATARPTASRSSASPSRADRETLGFARPLGAPSLRVLEPIHCQPGRFVRRPFDAGICLLGVSTARVADRNTGRRRRGLVASWTMRHRPHAQLLMAGAGPAPLRTTSRSRVARPVGHRGQGWFVRISVMGPRVRGAGRAQRDHYGVSRPGPVPDRNPPIRGASTRSRVTPCHRSRTTRWRTRPVRASTSGLAPRPTSRSSDTRRA